MSTAIVSTVLAVALSTTGGWLDGSQHRLPPILHSNGPVNPPGPGYGWGFPNGNPDGYGWWDHGVNLPLGCTADRTAEYFFPRYYSLPAEQMFFPTYYNPYVNRGQRDIPYAGCGGGPPIGGAPPPPP